jgi:hypothetical protein
MDFGRASASSFASDGMGVFSTVAGYLGLSKFFVSLKLLKWNKFLFLRASLSDLQISAERCESLGCEPHAIGNF